LIRVLYVIATLDAAGAERQMTHLCSRLDRSAFAPAVCCLTRGGSLESTLADADVPVRILDKRGRWDVGVIRRLLDTFADFQPDILHTWLPTSNTLGRIAGLLGGVPIMVSSERAADVWKGSARRMADRVLAWKTDAIIANADGVKNFLVDDIGLNENKISVIYNGIDLQEFDAASNLGPTAPLPARTGKPLLGAVARLEPQKGLSYLIQAMRILAGDGDAPELWIAGGGPDEATLRKEISDAGLDENITLLGARDDVPALMKVFDVFVLPSLWEGLPNVAIEAQAAGRPVIATAVDGTPEAVCDGKTALLVPPKDANALAVAIRELLSNAERCAAFGKAGRARVESVFGMSRMVAETELIYKNLFAQGARK